MLLGQEVLKDDRAWELLENYRLGGLVHYLLFVEKKLRTVRA